MNVTRTQTSVTFLNIYHHAEVRAFISVSGCCESLLYCTGRWSCSPLRNVTFNGKVSFLLHLRGKMSRNKERMVKFFLHFMIISWKQSFSSMQWDLKTGLIILQQHKCMFCVSLCFMSVNLFYNNVRCFWASHSSSEGLRMLQSKEFVQPRLETKVFVAVVNWHLIGWKVKTGFQRDMWKCTTVLHQRRRMTACGCF